ncbi:MAG: hypothetical protein U0802_07740 [Candidatus Binatia bacterium]
MRTSRATSRRWRLRREAGRSTRSWRCWRSPALPRCAARGRIARVLIAPAVAGAAVALAYDRFHERMLLGATVAALPLAGKQLGEGRRGRLSAWRWPASG